MLNISTNNTLNYIKKSLKLEQIESQDNTNKNLNDQD